jgi:hypothetical protein
MKEPEANQEFHGTDSHSEYLPEYDDHFVPPTTPITPSAVAEFPPAYALQSNFSIGTRVTPAPLVSASQLKAHLKLLRAFKSLRVRVEQSPGDFAPDAAALTPEKRWTWFLELAVERYVTIWLSNAL